MTTRAQLRKAALTFQEVEEDAQGGMVTYFVRGREFASVTRDGMVRLRLPVAAAEDAVATYPKAERLSHAGRPIGFQAPLADVDGQHLWSLVMTAWKHRAPQALAARLTAIVESPTQPGSDLPASIGKAATRALATAGLTTLDQVATRTGADLLALHGVGPKAVRILADALAERGMSLR
jgi:hypothetical protein